MSQRRGTPRAGRTIRDQPIRLGGVDYPHGIGTRSISEFVIDLKGNATRFDVDRRASTTRSAATSAR